MKYWPVLALAALIAQVSSAQTYAERLGWTKGDRVVILHVDDAGMSHESDLGVEQATTQGIANSFSVMMPCPWVPEIISYIKAHPDVDAGLHLTLTSEWVLYRWGPLAGKQIVPGLVDSEGALWPSVEAVAKHATAAEVEKEIHAQLDRAHQMGFQPTHLDSHMGTVFATPEFVASYIKVGVENHIPIMYPGGHDTLLAKQYRDETVAALKKQGKWQEGQDVPEYDGIAKARVAGKQVWAAGLPVLDDLHNTSYDWAPPEGGHVSDQVLQNWKVKKYEEAFHELKPGVTMVIMHCTDASAHFDSISSSGKVRRGDLLAMLSPELREALQREHLILTTWRELGRRRAAAPIMTE